MNSKRSLLSTLPTGVAALAQMTLLSFATAPAMASTAPSPLGQETPTTLGQETPTTLGQETPAPVGSQFQVNAYTTGSQSQARIGIADDGSFVAVWESAAFTGEPNGGIVARRFDSSGMPLGDDFLVSAHTGIDSKLDVAVDSDGDFVVAWHSTSDGSTRFQRFDSDGASLGGAVRLSNTSFNEVDVEYFDDDKFIVVRRAPGIGLNGSPVAGAEAGIGEAVLAMRFGPNGAPIDPSIQVATDDSFARSPQIAASDQGFMVVWTGGTPVGNDTDNTSIHGRIIDSSGEPVGDVFQINTITTGAQFNPTISSDGDGFVVFWESFESQVFDGRVGNLSGTEAEPLEEAAFVVAEGSAYSKIRGRRFDAGGSPLGQPLDVGPASSGGDQERPRVKQEPGGGFLVQWKESNLQLQRFDPQGQMSGDRLQVNTLGGLGSDPSAQLALSPTGQIVSIWHGTTSAGDDTDLEAIQSQRLSIPCDAKVSLCPELFADGFESGDPSAWTSTDP